MLQVASQNVIALLGNTGSGKSTLIQAISGKRLHRVVHSHESAAGIISERQVFETEDEALDGFQIGHTMVSETSHMHVFEQNGTIYLDSPGYGDTGGIETDIATSVMLKKVSGVCKSIRFVVLVNYTSLLEDRGGAIRSLAKLLKGFVKDFSANKQSFMLLFTHTDEISGNGGLSIEDVTKKLHGVIAEIAESYKLQGKITEETQVLKYMQKSLQKSFPFVQVYHPIMSNISTLVDAIENHVAKMPGELVSCNLTSQARHALDLELDLNIRELCAHLEQEDIPAVEAVITALQTLQRHIDMKSIHRAIGEAENSLQKHRRTKEMKAMDCIQKGTSRDGEIGEEELQGLVTTISRLEALCNVIPSDDSGLLEATS